MVYSKTKGLKYISLFEHSGYGEAARRYLTGLKNAGVDFTWAPMIPGRAWKLWYEPFAGADPGDPVLAPCCNRSVDYDTVVVHTVPEYYPLWKEREPGKKFIGYTVWETDRPPRHWVPILNGLDRLLVPCRWNKEVFERHGVSVPIHVVPHIRSRERPRPKEGGKAAGVYTFYTINTWTVRKALWATVTSFLEAFTARDAAVLTIKTSRRDMTRRVFGRFHLSTARAVKKILENYPDPAAIKLVTGELDRQEMLRIHEEGDCYVSLSRSEGWGLGAFDAAGYGKPVITTGFGGQLDYLPPDLAYLIDYKMTPVHDEAGKASYSGDQNWAEPDTVHASLTMRHVFENREEGRARGALLGDFVRSRFSESIVIRRLLKALGR